MQVTVRTYAAQNLVQHTVWPFLWQVLPSLGLHKLPAPTQHSTQTHSKQLKPTACNSISMHDFAAPKEHANEQACTKDLRQNSLKRPTNHKLLVQSQINNMSLTVASHAFVVS